MEDCNWYKASGVSCPKCFAHPDDYEDAFTIAADGNIAIADGVSSAIFSNLWAEVLTDGACKCPPDFDDISSWLGDIRAQWSSQVDFDSLGYFQKLKFHQVGGAHSTLLTLKLSLAADGTVEFHSQVYGDCCLFHVRGDEVLLKYPKGNSKEFEETPVALCSIDHGIDQNLTFARASGTAKAGDQLFLATDAVGEWLYKRLERELSVDWNQLKNLGDSNWQSLVEHERTNEDSMMPVDDSTMVRIEILDTYAPCSDSQ